MSSYLRVREKTRETDRTKNAAPAAAEAGSKEVPADLGGAALDAVVRSLFELSWGRARDLVRRGKVSIDGQTVTAPVKYVQAGSSVAIDLAARNTRTIATDLPGGALVYVDPHVVVVEKPAGIPTVPFDPDGMAASIARRTRQASPEPALDERVRIALARRERKSGPPPELGVVHRLDKETSGLLVFTRTWAAKKILMAAFRAHTIERRYLAIVSGDMKPKTIRTHFIENRGDGLRGSIEHRGGRKYAVGSERGQEAITHVEVVERLANGRATLVACVLETGRTHQIRIHLSEEGHPVAGDRVYTRGRDPSTLVRAPRLMLHAADLGFVHPATEEQMRWSSEPPEDMATVLASLRT